MAALVNLEGFGLPDSAASDAPRRYREWVERGRQLPESTVRDNDFGSPENLPFPRRRTEWIDDSGHMLHFEQPAILARLIEEFLLKPTT